MKRYWKSSCSHLALALLSTLAWSSVRPATASAQSSLPPAPPIRSFIDENGVDLVNGTFNRSVTLVSIGKVGAGGLSSVYFGIPNADSNTGQIALSGSTYIVSIGAESWDFSLSGSTFTSLLGDGATLVATSPSTATLTLRDGTVAQFSTSYYTTSGAPYGQPANLAQITSIQRPNGEIVTYNYEIFAYNPGNKVGPGTAVVFSRLQSITNNLGYMLKYAYQTNDDEISSYEVSSITAINNAFDYCSPTANTCSNLTYTWPTATIVGSQVTDALGRATAFPGFVGPSGIFSLPSGAALSLAFNGSGQVTSVSNGVGTWNYAYSGTATNQAVTVTDPLGHSRTVVANPTADTVISDTDANGHTTTYTTDTFGRVTNVTFPEGDGRSFTYDGRGNVLQIAYIGKSGGSFTTSSTFDATCSNPVKCNHPNTMTDANGNVTNYSYDPASGLLSSIVYPAGSAGAPHEVDIHHSQEFASFIQSAGAAVSQGPSAIWLVDGIAEGCATAQICSGTANATQDTLIYGQSSGSPNNLAPTEIVRAAGDGSLSVSVSVTYDQFGNPSTYTDANGNMSAFFYDAAHQITGTIGPDPDGSGPLLNRAIRYKYTPDGLLSEVDAGTAAGQSAANLANASVLASEISSYDALDRPISETLVTGQVTQAMAQLSFDASNRLQCSAVRLNPSTFGSEPVSACTQGTAGSQGPDLIQQVTYDAADEALTRVSGYGTSNLRTDVTNTYAPDGELATQSDGKGNLTTYKYDQYNRLYQIFYPSTSSPGSSSTTDYEQYTYDNNGNLITDRRRDGLSLTFSYDALNNPLVSANGATLTYDVLNRLSAASLNGKSATFSYDALGRSVSQISTLGSVLRRFDANGNRVSLVFPDGFGFNYTYDAENELTAISDTGGYNVANISYDNMGRRSALTRPGVATTTYGYDGGLRLSSLTTGFTDASKNNSITLSYDSASQIISSSFSNPIYQTTGHGSGTIGYAVDGQNRYLTSGGLSLTYDARSNLQADGVSTYSFDEANELVNVDNGQVALSYDGLGRLFQTQASSTTQFLYEGAQIIAEYSGGTLLRRYAPGAGLAETIAWYEGAGTADRRWLIADQKGSTIAVANSSGTLDNVNSYDEFGNGGASNVGRFQYDGYPYIQEAGLYFLTTRFYSTALGRFIQPDPAGYVDTMNLFNYTRSDPVNAEDPTGTDPLIGAGVGLAVGATFGFFGQALADHQFNLGKDLAAAGIGGVQGGLLGLADPTFGVLTGINIVARDAVAGAVYGILGDLLNQAVQSGISGKPLKFNLGEAAAATLGTAAAAGAGRYLTELADIHGGIGEGASSFTFGLATAPISTVPTVVAGQGTEESVIVITAPRRSPTAVLSIPQGTVSGYSIGIADGTYVGGTSGVVPQSGPYSVTIENPVASGP